MPIAKVMKAYKFARPFHGPYQISDTAVVVHPIDKLQAESIRVAYDITVILFLISFG